MISTTHPVASLPSTAQVPLPPDVLSSVDPANDTEETPSTRRLPQWGTLGGALSWPIPPSEQHQRGIKALISDNSERLDGLPPISRRGGALDYLLNGQRLSQAELRDPDTALEKLLATPRALALGNAIQAKLDGFPNDTHVADYVLAAIQISLDPESLESPGRNKVAGFDLANRDHWGKPASTVIEALALHLENDGRIAQGAGDLAARLLLARTAPQFLVKDVPAQVVYGSLAWAQLSIAVATIEAQTPGEAANMTFAEIMIAADGHQPLSAQVQKPALIDWAVVNRIVDLKDDARYTQDELDNARDAFNFQQEKLKAVSGLLDIPLPTRKQLALDLLKKTFGEDAPFEEQMFRINLKTDTPRLARLSDTYSMLDITMQGLKMDPADWEQTKQHATIDLNAFAVFTRSPDFKVPQTFNDQVGKVISGYKDIKKHLLLNTITQLPPDDQDNLRWGKLNFFQEKSYKTSAIPFAGETLFHTSNKILLRTENTKSITTYEFNTETGHIKKVKNAILTRAPQYLSNEVTRIEEFFPFGTRKDHIKKERPLEGSNPHMFRNLRANYIADSLVEGLDLDALKRQAAGSTPSESKKAQAQTLGNFFLNLIPLRSAIVNFSNGNYKDGFIDLSLDVFGFVTSGWVAKAAKALETTGSAVNKTLKLSKILGAAAIGELNPLAGLDNLATGAAKLSIDGVNAVTQGLRSLKGTANSADLIAAGHRYDAAAVGTLKIGEQMIEGSAVLHNGKWYAFDADRMQPYGSPLEAFDPTDTLMPPSPNTRDPINRGAHRFNPLSTVARPSRPRKPLPEGTYAESLKGKLEADHFKPDTRQATMDKFKIEMENFYDAIDTDSLPPRPIVPADLPPMPVSDLINEAFKLSNGVIFGESHNQMASFKVLFNNVDSLKNQGVKKLYLEGYIDMPNGPIDDGIGMLGSTGQRRSDPSLEQLKQKFEASGIEILPIDHYYLTRHKYDKTRDRTTTGNNTVKRLKEFNYYASETIQANSGTEKWVALVGHSHMNTSEGVPGMAELTGGLGIGIFDNANMNPRSLGLKAKNHIPDPNGPIKRGDLPGDLHIYVKP